MLLIYAFFRTLIFNISESLLHVWINICSEQFCNSQGESSLELYRDKKWKYGKKCNRSFKKICLTAIINGVQTKWRPLLTINNQWNKFISNIQWLFPSNSCHRPSIGLLGKFTSLCNAFISNFRLNYLLLFLFWII